MNRNLALALAVGLALVPFASAQTPAPAGPAADVKPEAIPAKVAVIAFEQAVVATNEGKQAFLDLQKKYEPKKTALDSLGAEVDSLKKQLQALPANTSDDERASRLKVIDEKEKQLQRDGEDAQNSYNDDVQKALGALSQKVGAVMVKYTQDNGFTLLLNVGGNQQTPNPVLWFAAPTDITQAVINAYNASSGVAAPAPAAPTPQKSSTTHSSTAPAHPATK